MPTSDAFYGADQALIHHERFGGIARGAAELLLGRLEHAGIHRGTVVDLGTGSGILARIVSDAGFDVVGVDISPAMVDLAREYAPRATISEGSLLDVELPRSVGVTVIGEGLNYATDPRAGFDEVARTARRVYEALDPGGVFLFDISTPGRGRELGSYERFHDGGDWVLHMRAEEHPREVTLDRKITIFRQADDGCYHRTDELHVLRLYDADAVAAVLRGIGFTVEVLDRYPSGGTTASESFPGWVVIVATR
jgi:SAM-dependent methyltransferase